MPPNPSTPPNETTSVTSAGIDYDVADGAVNNLAHYTTQQFASPISNVHMGFDEKSELEGRAESQDTSDEESMSDGGVPLEMIYAQAEEMDVELVMPDLQTNQDTLDAILESSHFPTTSEDVFPGSPSFQQPHNPEMPDSFVDLPNYPPGIPMVLDSTGPFSLPTTMSAVSFQPEHIQDQDLQEGNLQGSQHAEFMAGAPNAAEHSTASISYQNHNSTSVEAGGGAGQSGSYVSPAELVISSNTLVPVEGNNVSNAPSMAGLDPSIAPSASSHHPNFIHVNGGSHPHFSWTFLEDNMSDDETQDEADNGEVQHPVNHHLIEFLSSWNHRLGSSADAPRGHAISALLMQNAKLPSVQRRDLQGENCDIQGINWSDLGVGRLEARQMRRQTYINYTSLEQNSIYRFTPGGKVLADDQNFFRFRKMNFEHNVRLTHFQLRNLLVCPTRDYAFYAASARILHCNLQSNKRPSRATTVMDFTNPIVHPFYSTSGTCQITALAGGHDILVAGGHDGEYGIMNLKASDHTRPIEGLVIDHENSITNHIQVHLSRGSSLPVATFASNDNGVRILDVNTNTFVAEHRYDFAINCTAISPDQRLRVQVGDTRQVMICNAATGEVLQSLEGHRDYGFACAWADDGWTVATGNQDKLVKIWDARRWTNSAGIAQPVTTIASTMAGVRSLKFSPLGSGKRVLVAAEPADIVNVIDGETFASKQTLSFFGEIGGFDFTNDGQDLVVANCDFDRGGLIEYERCDFSGATTYLEDYKESTFRKRAAGQLDYYDHDGYDRLKIEERSGSRARASGIVDQRSRRSANLAVGLGLF